MKHLLVIGSLVVAGAVSAQEPKTGLTRKTPKKVVATNAPVTRTEARTVFLRAEKVLRTALSMPGTPASSINAGAQPITRAEVVGEFNRLYTLAKPAAKLSPRAVRFDAARLRMAGSQKENLLRLVRLGAVAPIGPVAVGPKDSLTVAEFGDALGYFLARMAEITHMPSRKWTPALQDE